jgi:hypothetical protein
MRFFSQTLFHGVGARNLIGTLTICVIMSDDSLPPVTPKMHPAPARP